MPPANALQGGAAAAGLWFPQPPHLPLPSWGRRKPTKYPRCCQAPQSLSLCLLCPSSGWLRAWSQVGWCCGGCKAENCHLLTARTKMAKIPITCQRRSPQITTVSEVTGSGFFLGGSVVAWEREGEKKEKNGLRLARGKMPPRGAGEPLSSGLTIIQISSGNGDFFRGCV